MGIDGGVLRKDRVGCYFISTVFLRVPAKEVIAVVGRSRQARQLPVFGGDADWAYAAAVGVKGHRVLLRRLFLPMSVDGGVICKDCVGSDFLSAVFLRVPAKEVIAVVGRSRQARQLPVFGGGAGWAYAAAVGVKGHRVLLCCLFLPVSVDGGVICKDRVVRYFISASFFRVPAKEGIAVIGRGRQAFQLPVFSGDAGWCHAAAVGVKGHRVLLRRLFLPMSVDGGVLRKDRVGSDFLSTSFFRVPAKEVIAVIGRGRQAFQLPVCGGGAGWCHAAAIGVKGHGILLTHRRCDLAFIPADVALCVLVVVVAMGGYVGLLPAGALMPVAALVRFPAGSKVVGMDCYVPHIRHGDRAVCHADCQIHCITGKVDAVGPVLLVEAHGIVAVLQLTAAAQEGHRHRAAAAVFQAGRIAVIHGHAILFQHIGQGMVRPSGAIVLEGQALAALPLLTGHGQGQVLAVIHDEIPPALTAVGAGRHQLHRVAVHRVAHAAFPRGEEQGREVQVKSRAHTKI